MKTLFKHQVDGIEFLTKKQRAGLWDDMGLGKTAQAILAMKELGATRILVVCPATLRRVWEDAIREWYPDATIMQVKGQRMERLMKVKFEIAEQNPTFVIINYELIHQHVADLNRIALGGLIFDEAHRLKNRDTKVHMAASLLARRHLGKPCFALSGTPILNRTEELFSMLHIIDPVNHSSYWKWAQEHLATERIKEDTRWRVLVIGGPQHPERFKFYVSQYGLRRIKEDCLDLPPKIYETIDIELTGPQLKAYKSMRDHYYMELSEVGEEIGAPNVISAMTRLKQIAVSTALVDHTIEGIPGAKLEAMEELFEDSGDLPIVVFTQFAEAAVRFKEHFSRKYPCATITGKDTMPQRNVAVDLFQANKLKGLFVSILAGGVGITLTAGKIAIFTDLLWTPALNNQAVDRLHRIGQADNVTVYTLNAVDTIEDYILQVLGNKQALFDASIPVTRLNAAYKWRELLR